MTPENLLILEHPDPNIIEIDDMPPGTSSDDGVCDKIAWRGGQIINEGNLRTIDPNILELPNSDDGGTAVEQGDIEKIPQVLNAYLPVGNISAEPDEKVISTQRLEVPAKKKKKKKRRQNSQ